MTTDERAICLSTARQLIVNYLAFSTLRYYAVSARAVKVTARATTVVIECEVPTQEIHAVLWSRDR